MVIVAAAMLASSTDAALARSGHHALSATQHGSRSHTVERAATPQAFSSAGIIDQAQMRQNVAPGVTRAIDQGAQSTATGGPVGGLPGNSGGP